MGEKKRIKKKHLFWHTESHCNTCRIHPPPKKKEAQRDIGMAMSRGWIENTLVFNHGFAVVTAAFGVFGSSTNIVNRELQKL